jgi:hypothetical protein
MPYVSIPITPDQKAVADKTMTATVIHAQIFRGSTVTPNNKRFIAAKPASTPLVEQARR